MRLTIVSGGQTGADRGAMDAAIRLGLDYGGWAPSGFRAEDGRIPEIYASHMRESSSPEYGMRTRLNVQDSDATLIVSYEPELTGGSAGTAKAARGMKRRCKHLVLPQGDGKVPDELRVSVLEWLREGRVEVLNVAGPRESKEPGVQVAVRDVLVWLLEDVVTEQIKADLDTIQLLESAIDSDAPHPYAPGEKMTDRHPNSVIAQAVEQTITEHKPPDPAELMHLHKDGDHIGSDTWCERYLGANVVCDLDLVTCQNCLGAASQFGSEAARRIPRYRSGPLQEEHRIDALHPWGDGNPLGSFTLRLYYKRDEEERTHWVNFELFEVTSTDHPCTGRLEYASKGAMNSEDTTADLEQAETTADGFVKWDGCTQFEMSSVHIDGKNQLDNLLHAISEVRRLCAAAMVGTFDSSEYQ